MPATHVDPKHTGGDTREASPSMNREREPRPAARVCLVPYSTDEVQWHDLDEYPLAY
jgi:hypothetical protein